MTFWLFVLLFYTPSIIEDLNDPMDGLLGEFDSVDDWICQPMSIEAARRLEEATLELPEAREDFLERRAVRCRQRLLPRGVRPARDEAILDRLRDIAAEHGSLVADLNPELRDRTWLVEAYYPDVAVGQKVAFAAKTALVDRGLKVSDRAPTLAAGDLEVIGRLPPSRAYPLACTRWAQAGALGAEDALMAVALRHPQETALHLGVCADGRWRWLQ